MSAITDNRRQRFFAPAKEYNLVQLVEDAKTRWLKPIEVCEILSNHQRLQLSRNPPSKPSSGSMFLFDRKALRYFRKDGHNWRKKKDGKTVREAHEKLKAGSVDVLHCYYAHGEDNPKFQRRSYWMLDGAYDHIVLVHYREVIEGNRACLASSLPNTLSTEGTMQDLPQQSAQNSIYWDANSYFPPSFDSSPSEILSSNMNQEDEGGSEEEFDNSTTPWEGREGQPISLETGVRELDTGKVTATNNFQTLSSSLGLGTTITAVSGPTNLTFYKSGSLSFPNTSTSELQQLQIDVLNKNDNQQQPQTGSYKGDWLELENMDMSELLEHQGSGKLSTAETLDSSTWKQLLDSANSMAEGKLSNWKELLDQLPPPSSGEVSEPMVTRNIAVNANISSFEIKSEVDSKIDSFLPDKRSDVPMLTRSLLEALSPKGLGRKPQTALEAHLQETIQKNSLRKAAAEDIMDSTSPWKSVEEQQQNNNLVYLGSMHKQNIVNHDPQEWRLQIQQQIKHQGQDEVHSHRKEHFLQSHSLKPVEFDGSGLLLPNTSESLKGIQSDTGSFKKQDSFGSWIAKEFGDSQDISLPSSSVSESYWGASIEDQRIMGESLKLSQQVQLNAVLSSSLSQEQHFSIVDFSPEWSYSSDETKVIVSGMYLDKLKSPTDYKWCCMFGEIEVAAEILPTGALRCRAPPHEPGRVPFYLTCNDRVACSEIREFEYRAKPFISGEGSATDTISVQEEEEMLLKVRFSRLLSTTGHVSSASENDVQESTEISNQECALCIEENEWIDLESLATGMRQDFQGANEKLLQTLLKQKLQQWLHCQVHKEGKGASILDEHGVGVLHMAAALGYEWAIAPILAAGVGVNFRDTRGWTALHWAAHCGREKVVVALLAADASAGALTDPTPKCPTGHTAADLAASRRHGGIAGYLAEASLTSHLSLLNVRESEMDKISAAVAGDIAVEAVSEKCSVNPSRGLTEDELSLKDTLAAVRNAAQAATRIQAVFRAHSFIKKQQAMESRVDEFGMLQGEVRSIAAAQLIQRAYRGHREKLNLAATHIQCKYRGWKGRKDFLTLKHQVVKIQAHVRGHQVRKKYKILWTVGVLDKAILRWRRKGHGLRGFRSAENGEEDSNDEDFLKDFRRQKEAAFEEELTRVQFMVQSPEAQHQYRRMLENFQRTKVGQASEATVDEEELLMSLLD